MISVRASKFSWGTIKYLLPKKMSHFTLYFHNFHHPSWPPHSAQLHHTCFSICFVTIHVPVCGVCVFVCVVCLCECVTFQCFEIVKHPKQQSYSESTQLQNLQISHFLLLMTQYSPNMYAWLQVVYKEKDLFLLIICDKKYVMFSIVSKFLASSITRQFHSSLPQKNHGSG